jgi:hypothetical protein
MIVSAARFGTPWSHSLMGGTISPSSYTDVAPDGIDPGTQPPMSSWCPKACTNATTSGSTPRQRDLGVHARRAPEANTGTVTHRSGRWPMPPSER